MRNKICIHEECSTRANFNYKGIKPALYCSKHKLENMVDVNNKIAVKNDFSGSVIYKIYCKDENIKDFYIGSSKDLYDRMRVHKSMCYNENDRGYSLKIYEFIRENGDWENFNVEIVEYYPCKNDKELKQREQYYIKKYEPTLNCFNAYITQEEKKEKNKLWKKSEKGKEYQRKYTKNFINNSEKYQQKLEKKKIWGKLPKFCEICNRTVTNDGWSAHLKTKIHLENIEKKNGSAEN